jgi:hypothetical protein
MPRRSRRISGIAAAFALLAATAALARAEGPTDAVTAPDPYGACEDGGALATAAGNCGPSTDQTPGNPGDTSLFDQVAGAKWKDSENDPETKVMLGSPTSFDDNLYTVAFSLQQGVGGIAGGANCENSEPNETNPAELDSLPKKEYGCVPVLYQYKVYNPTHGVEWRQVKLPGGNDPGYIGAVAWISNTGQALAVGGTGRYPRRDPAYRETEDPNDPTSKPCQQWDVLDDAQDPTDPSKKIRSGQRRRLIGAYGANCDPAGSARAWLYNKDGDGRWEEITDELPTKETTQSVTAGSTPGAPAQPPFAEPAKTYTRRGMGGMTALACNPALGAELCYAGALGQMWEWQNDSFDKEPFDSQSALDGQGTAGGRQNVWRFRFRVRQVRFVPGELSPLAHAVTAGCCAESAAKNQPRLLGRVGSGVWSVNPLRFDPVSPSGAGTAGNSAAGPAGSDALKDAGSVTPYQHRPDSFFSVMARRINADSTGIDGPMKFSAIASPGGPAHPGEPPSQITSRYCGPTDGNVQGSIPLGVVPRVLLYDSGDLTRVSLSTARLIAGDGDLSLDTFPLVDASAVGPLDTVRPLGDERGSPASHSYAGELSCGAFSESNSNTRPETDAVPDWVIGELRSTHRPGLGARGLLWANPQRPSFAPETIVWPVRRDKGSIKLDSNCTGGCYSTVPLADVTSGNYTPTDPVKLQAWAKAPYFALPSYGINALDIVGESASGWAVGDHGAILRLNGDDVAKQAPEPELPHLGARRPAALPDSSPYADRTPSQDAAPGEVPSLASQPRQRLGEPRLVAAGAPDPSVNPFSTDSTSAASIAMSRDGSEGWAVGSPNATTLYHYDGAEWVLCDPKGVKGQLPADPACAGVARIFEFPGSGGGSDRSHLSAIARVPLEKDSDPANDDEFEAVAVGTGYVPERFQKDAQGRPIPEATILRYRNGRWDFEDPAVVNGIGGGAQIAFTSPDDGWILGGQSISHFDGERWTKCVPGSSACGDQDEGRLTSEADGSTHLLFHTWLGLASAGDRVYIYGNLKPLVGGAGAAPTGQTCPVILYHDRGADRWHGDPEGKDGSLDPGYDAAARKTQACDEREMRLDSFTVGRRADGAYEGWAFGQRPTTKSPGGLSGGSSDGGFVQSVLRLTPDAGLQPFQSDDALRDYFNRDRPTSSATDLMLPRPDGGLDSFVVEGDEFQGTVLLKFDSARQRWRIERGGGAGLLAPDNEGGFWATSGKNFLHYTDHPPKPVFSEVPNPAGPSGYLTAAAPGANGQLWLATNSDTLYRYDRASGWDKLKVPGWDPGRVVTRPSSASAIAVNEQGVGVLVGEQGRIADINSNGDGGAVRLDAAAGAPLNCRIETPPPCGTGRDLTAVAVAPEGSAIVAGRSLALLWRDGANGSFQAIEKPDAAAQTKISAVSMPARDRAYLTTETGFLFRGDMGAPGQWSWTLENTNEKGDALIYDPSGRQLALRALALDAEGRGYAVGDRGLVLQRTGEGAHPWRRLKTPFLDNFTTVGLPQGGGPGALVGAEEGAIYTLVRGRFEIAQPPDVEGKWGGKHGDLFVRGTRPVGLALLGGPKAGQTEAWVALQGDSRATGNSALLHYASDPAEPLLDPMRRAEPLADTQAPRAGELSFATFGGTRCMRERQSGGGSFSDDCPIAMALTNEDYETYTQGIIEAIAAASKRPGGPAFSLFSGDMTNTLGPPTRENNVHSPVTTFGVSNGGNGVNAEAKTLAMRKLRYFSELVADPLEAEGVPFFATPGGGDITSPGGDNFLWRLAMEHRRRPWGDGESAGAHGLSFEGVSDGPDTVRPDDQGLGDVHIEDPDGDTTAVGETRVKTNGADTHYALDVSRDGEKIARLIFADSSTKTLGPGSDPLQNPIESKTQMDWLERMLCPVGQRTKLMGTSCTREPSTQAIVVTNTPSYNYGQSQGQVMGAEGSLFEKTLLDNRANLVVSGRIGWNGLYYALSNGLHDPQPGGSYPPSPPAPLAGQPDPVPFVVASGAGRFAEDANDQSSAPAGYWHGYTVVRLDPSGDYRKTIVEQRPLLDFLAIAAERHVLRPGQKLALRGVGREPIASAVNTAKTVEVRFDEISNAAITHRYDLVYADPEKPWVAKQDEQKDKCDPYDCLPGDVGSIDDQSGAVQAGGGQQDRTYALAILSVGEKVATFPLVFEPRPSFRAPPPPAAIPLPPASAPPPAPAPPAPNPPFSPPTLATPPPLPPLPAQTPLAPPAPPAPPGGGPAQLDLFTSPPVLTVAPSVSLFPPSAPVINVAPPTPARPVEKAKKVAVQKSGSGIGDDRKRGAEASGDSLANAPMPPPGSAYTRSDPNAFTAVAHRDQASAWARDLQWGGGLVLMGLVLALGWVTVKPTPRQRTPEVPAPSYARARRR